MAQLSLNNLILHDEADYEGIRKNIYKILKEKGCSNERIPLIAQKVKEIYMLADIARRNRVNGNYSLEEETYKKMEKIADEIDDDICQKKYSKFEIKWWKYWRQNKFLRATIQLLRYNLLQLGPQHPIGAVKNTYYLINAGICHNNKDWKKALKHMEKAWETFILSKDEMPFVF